MRIVYIYPALTTVGGADRVIADKSNYLAEKCGYEVYIITAHQNGQDTSFALSDKIKHIDLDVDFMEQYKHSFFIRGYIYLKMIFLYKRRLTRLLKKLKADFILTTISRDIDFIHTIKDGSIKIAEAHSPKQYLRNLHRLQKKNILYRISGRIWTKRLEKAAKKFKAFVVLTEEDAKSWAKIRPCTVIPNPLPFFPETTSTCTNKRVISVGRLYEEKGFDRLIEAWSMVAAKYPDWKLHIYGEGILRKNLQHLIQKKELTHSVFLEGPVDNIMDKYLESSIYVMSSRFEGFGMVLIEAMACGLPVVSFNCPVGPATIVKDGVDGFLVENSNSRALAEKLCYLIENENIRTQMGQQGRENVRKFRQENIMQEWIKLFHSLKG